MATTQSLQDVLNRYTGLKTAETAAITNFYNDMVAKGLWAKFVEVWWFTLDGGNARIGAKVWTLENTTGSVTPEAKVGINFTDDSNIWSSAISAETLYDYGVANFGDPYIGMGCKVYNHTKKEADSQIDLCGVSSVTGLGGWDIRHHGTNRLQLQVASHANNRFGQSWMPTHGAANADYGHTFASSNAAQCYSWLKNGDLIQTGAPIAIETVGRDQSYVINGRGSSATGGELNASACIHEYHYLLHDDGTLTDQNIADIAAAFDKFKSDLDGEPVDIVGTTINTASSSINPTVVFNVRLDIDGQTVDTTSASIGPSVKLFTAIDITGTTVNTASGTTAPTVWFYVPLFASPQTINTASISQDPQLQFLSVWDVDGETGNTQSAATNPAITFFSIDGIAVDTASASIDPTVNFAARVDLSPQTINSLSESNDPVVILQAVLSVVGREVNTQSDAVLPMIQYGLPGENYADFAVGYADAVPGAAYNDTKPKTDYTGQITASYS